MGATVPFAHRSCGYVGTTDGWTDLADNFRMDWEFDVAEDGNIALIGELDLRQRHEFTLGLSFGNSLHHATTTLLQSLAFPFAGHRERFVAQWGRACQAIASARPASGDGGRLYHASHSLLLAHEDKSLPRRDDRVAQHPVGRGQGRRGSRRISPRVDARHGATARPGCWPPATPTTPLRLLHLSRVHAAPRRRDSTRTSGSMGEPYWRGIQLDEVAFPILLAWRLHEAERARRFRSLCHGAARRRLSRSTKGRSRRRSAGKRTAATRPRRWRRTSPRSSAPPSFARERGDAGDRRVRPATTPISSSATSRPGPSRPTARSCPASRGTTSAFDPVDPDDPEPDEDPEPRRPVDLATARPASARRVPRQGNRGRAGSSSWCVTESGRRQIPHRGLAARRGRGAQGRDAVWPVLAPIQP